MYYLLVSALKKAEPVYFLEIHYNMYNCMCVYRFFKIKMNFFVFIWWLHLTPDSLFCLNLPKYFTICTKIVKVVLILCLSNVSISKGFFFNRQHYIACVLATCIILKRFILLFLFREYDKIIRSCLFANLIITWTRWWFSVRFNLVYVLVRCV